jgi:hypothetical protein
MRRLLATGVIIIGLVMAIVSGESRAAPTLAQSRSNGSTQARPQLEPPPVCIRGAVILENGAHVPLGVRVELLLGGTVVLQDVTVDNHGVHVTTAIASPYSKAGRG